jgi:hypothetical protein
MESFIGRELISNETEDFPQVGAAFTSPAKSAASLEWLDCMLESNAILSAILAVIHPDLYNSGRETFNHLRNAAEIQPQQVLRRWTSVFNGVAVIRNRKTPLHRDGKSRFQWYDLLVTLGQYVNCHLELPGLGVSLEYGPGTVVGLSGMLLAHEVPSFEGDRVCYAYFMRNKVHQWANTSGYTWMNKKYYERDLEQD